MNLKRLATILFLCLWPLPAVRAADSVVKMVGTYVWFHEKDEPREVRAEFRQLGKEKWRVQFFFQIGPNKYVYSGEAQGDPREGILKGEVQNEGKVRTFQFRGEHRDGHFEGVHFEMKRGKPGKVLGNLFLSLSE